MESILQEVGPCGWFQFFHALCVHTIRSIGVFSLNLMIYGIYEPPWHCVVDEAHNNTSSALLNTSYYGSSTHANLPLENRTDTPMSPTGLHHSMLPEISSMINSSTGNDSHLFREDVRCDQITLCKSVAFDPTAVTLVSDFELICDQAYVPPLITAVQMTGMLVGSVAAGQIGELLGRKVCIYASLAVTSATMFVSAWSTSWHMFTCFVFVIGMGSSGIITMYMMYSSEFLTTKWRGRISALPIWNIYLLLFAAMIAGLKNWRYVHMTCGGLGGVFLLFALWTPESLRWLLVHGKREEAKKVLNKIIKCNSSKGSVSDTSMALENPDITTINDDTPRSQNTTYLDLFRTPEIRSVTIKASIIAFLVNISYFTLGLSVKSFSGHFYTNLFISFASEVPFVLILGLFINRVGRRLTLSAFMFISSLFLVACIITHFTVNEEMVGPVFKYLAFLAKGCCILAWSCIALFIIELYPTEVRSLALGLSNTVSRAGSVVAAALIPRDQRSAVLSFIVLAIALVICAILTVSFRETKESPLHDRIHQGSNRERSD